MDKNQNNRKKLFKKIVSFSILGIAGLLVILVLVSAISNIFLPSAPDDSHRLSHETTFYASESLHLMAELGSEIWPGFQDDIPIILWNEEVAFLFNQPDPLSDWQQLDQAMIRGLPVYTQLNLKPYQAFTETLSDGAYAGSMATKNLMNRELIGLFRQNLPPVIDQIFPYQLLLQPSDLYITTLVHESFHAYQAENYPERFTDAERAYSMRSAYEGLFEEMREGWTAEIQCLQNAVKEEDPTVQIDLVQKFLELRANRRKTAGLTPNLELYEKRFEWLEGSAKYVELGIWQSAGSESYQPLEMILEDPDFHSYQGYPDRWETELKNMERAAKNGGETLFYYSGMLQARLLDDLLPNWKSRMGEPEVWLEDLLEEAIS